MGRFKKLGFAVVLFSIGCLPSDQETAEDPRIALNARAAAHELDTDYVAPPGDPLHHETAGFAKILCSAVFITGLDAEDAAANVGGFISHFEERGHVVDT
ncbi:uncharacterized protein METZ01_LOCUS273779, partial [marine metagenome]